MIEQRKRLKRKRKKKYEREGGKKLNRSARKKALVHCESGFFLAEIYKKGTLLAMPRLLLRIFPEMD
jgi:hypothetical protein